MPQIHLHNPQSLTSILTSHLPRSLALLRRLQFHFQSSHVRIFATFPANSPPNKDEIWSAAFVDRSRAPETECWIFTSYQADKVKHDSEAESRVTSDLTSSNPTDTSTTVARTQLHSLLHAIRTQTSPSEKPDISAATLLIGAVHEDTASLLTSVTKFRSEAWLTFTYQVGRPASESDTESEALLSSLGLSWSTVLPAEYGLVRSRTQIQRSDSTLGVLVSVGLRREGRLVAWAFLGVDGSLSGLFVEEGLRGKGVGRVIARRVLEELWRGGGFEVDGEEERAWRWGFSHAGVENKGSIAVAKALGGQLGWTDYWITVNL